MDVLDDYIDLYKEEGDARIFTLLFNTSNLISPAYAAAIVLGISFGIAALAGLLYYALIGGFDSDGGYGGYSQYSSYLQKLGFRRRRSIFEDDLEFVSILKSLNLTEDNFNQHGNEIDDNDPLSTVNLCKIKRKICQTFEISKSLPRKNGTQNNNIAKLNLFFADLRKIKEESMFNEKQKHQFIEDILNVEEQLRQSENCDDLMKRQKCSNS